MDRLRGLQVFLEVARDGSFTGAARRLGVSKASVTKQVAALEHALRARLLHRTTKQVGLTEAGLTVLHRGRLLLEGYDEIESEVRDSLRAPRGVVRVGTPPSFGAHHLLPRLAGFAERYPDIRVALTLDDGSANLIAQGLDLSVRITPSRADSNYVAEPLFATPQVLVAAPGYLARRGTPERPADLTRHNCLVHALKSPTSIWRFTGPEGETALRVGGSIYSNFGEALKQAALIGHGISMHPTYMVADDMAAGRLVAVLPRHVPETLDVYVIYSARETLPMRVRRLVEFLKDWARTPPAWAQAPGALAAPSTDPAAR